MNELELLKKSWQNQPIEFSEPTSDWDKIAKQMDRRWKAIEREEGLGMSLSGSLVMGFFAVLFFGVGFYRDLLYWKMLGLVASVVSFGNGYRYVGLRRFERVVTANTREYLELSIRKLRFLNRMRWILVGAGLTAIILWLGLESPQLWDLPLPKMIGIGAFLLLSIFLGLVIYQYYGRAQVTNRRALQREIETQLAQFDDN